VARKKDIIVNIRSLERELGIPVVPVNPRKNKGIAQLKKAVDDTANKFYRPPAFDFISNKALAPEAVTEVKELLPHLRIFPMSKG
jgi:ferrous iron transport protein B